MPRQVREANLSTREARQRLSLRHKPYFRALDEGLHLGYRKSLSGGAWVVRRYVGKGTYRTANLEGRPDDVLAADGATVLSWNQAQATARAWFQQQARIAEGLAPARKGPYTVADAIADYLAHYKGEGKSLAATEAAINAHILPALGESDAAKLAPARIKDWHRALAKAPARLRTGKRSKKANHRPAATDADAIRRRRATANRVLTILKAALNHAWKEGHLPSDAGWRPVKPFRDVDAPVVRYLTEAECARLVNACAGDFRRMVQAALLSGCRYSELAALKVADYNPDAGTLAIRASKSGKARHVVLTDEGQEFFDAATAGREGAAILFPRADGKSWGRAHQFRPMREACARAKIIPPASFHVLRHSHGSLLAMKGVPLPVIARQLGHADTRMTEKHYAHLSPGYVADTIREHFPKLGIADAGNVKRLRGKARAGGKK